MAAANEERDSQPSQQETLHQRSPPGSGSSTSTPSKSLCTGTNQASAGSTPNQDEHVANQGEEHEIFNTCNSGSEEEGKEETKIQQSLPDASDKT